MKANSISTKNVLEPHWTDTDTERDPRPKDLDEHVEMRRKGKRLQDVELPKGFRLISERVKQHWMLNQLVWGFWLGWGKTDRHGTPTSRGSTRRWPKTRRCAGLSTTSAASSRSRKSWISKR